MEQKINLGLIGYGARGTGLLKDTILPLSEAYDVTVCAVCDLYQDRAEAAADKVEKETGKRPLSTTDYNEVLTNSDINTVVISTSWEAHVEVAVAAMKAGKYVGLEVGGAYSIDDCWELIHTHNETNSNIMMLENCCYGKRELMIMNMVRKGLFGDVVYCAGGYHHDLRSEIADGIENRHYRLRNYLNRNCENYPTHEIGPISKILNINNGNRFLSLTSTASCSRGMHSYLVDRKGLHNELSQKSFNQGDIITTVLKCANGETVTIVLDTTLPRTYSRGFEVRGTKGGYWEDNDSINIDKRYEKYEFNGKKLWGNAKRYEKSNMHPLWQNYDPKGGHDGMDWLVFEAFFDAVKTQVKPPIDVYDIATWMSISALSEQSISTGSMPVAMPDFTDGKWLKRTDIVDSKYCLDIIK